MRTVITSSQGQRVIRPQGSKLIVQVQVQVASVGQNPLRQATIKAGLPLLCADTYDHQNCGSE
ncbi:hypothetical protein D3C73_517140 [compost metagenome]